MTTDITWALKVSALHTVLRYIPLEMSSNKCTYNREIRIHNWRNIEFQGHSTHSNISTLSQTTKFSLFQTERVCRRQFEFNVCTCIWRKVFQKGRKYHGKVEIAHYNQFLLSHNVFKSL